MIGQSNGWGGNGDGDALSRTMNVSRSNASATIPSSLVQIYRCYNIPLGRSQKYSRSWQQQPAGQSHETFTPGIRGKDSPSVATSSTSTTSRSERTARKPFATGTVTPFPLSQHPVRVVGISLQNDSCESHVDTYCVLHNMPAERGTGGSTVGERCRHAQIPINPTLLALTALTLCLQACPCVRTGKSWVSMWHDESSGREGLHR